MALEDGLLAAVLRLAERGVVVARAVGFDHHALLGVEEVDFVAGDLDVRLGRPEAMAGQEVVDGVLEFGAGRLRAERDELRQTRGCRALELFVRDPAERLGLVDRTPECLVTTQDGGEVIQRPGGGGDGYAAPPGPIVRSGRPTA